VLDTIFFLGVFKSVVVITVQSDFCSEIHQNNIFLFLKNYFGISTLKQFENIKKLILNKKFKFLKNTISTASPNNYLIFQRKH